MSYSYKTFPPLPGPSDELQLQVMSYSYNTFPPLPGPSDELQLQDLPPITRP